MLPDTCASAASDLSDCKARLVPNEVPLAATAQNLRKRTSPIQLPRKSTLVK